MCCDCRIFCSSSAIAFCVLPVLLDCTGSPTVNLAVSMLFKVSRKLLELGAVPRNGAVTVYRHANPPDSWPDSHASGKLGQGAAAAAHRGHRFRKVRSGRSRFRPFFAIEATAGEPSNNKLAWRSVLSAVPSYRPGGRTPARRNGACNGRIGIRSNCRCRAEGNRAGTDAAFVDGVAGFRLASEGGRQAHVPAPRPHDQDSPCRRGAEAIQVKRYRIS